VVGRDKKERVEIHAKNFDCVEMPGGATYAAKKKRWCLGINL